MKVRLVCYEDVDSWILGKFARKMYENLMAMGVQTDIAKVPDPTADINHHIIYFDYDGKPCTTETVMITHLDAPWKVEKVCQQMLVADLGVCMSTQTVEMLAARGVPREKLCYVLPAHDEVVSPRKIVIGLNSRIYSDGRKRESMLVELASQLSPKDFAFKIMGAGWEPVVEALRGRGFHVDYYSNFDYNTNIQMMPSLDYYLNLGFDEGAMAFVDALAAGVRTICTPQGYHLDAPGGITHPFETFDELLLIFRGFITERQRLTGAVADWTWKDYTVKHFELWQWLLSGRDSSLLTQSKYRDGLSSIKNQSNPQRPPQVNSHLDFINSGNNNRTIDFLTQIKNSYLTNIERADEWIWLCDPNNLRSKGVSLPPLFASHSDIFKANYSLNINDHIGWHIFLKGYFDPVPTLFLKLLKIIGVDGTYIDVGANIGSTCIPIALDGIECFAIEASNSTCAELLKNLSLNPSIKATAINAAVCSPSQVHTNRHSEIFRSEGNFAAGSLYKNWNKTGSRDFKENVINVTLDKVIDFYNIDKILLLKLDIDGYEYFALEGFQESLNSMKPVVMFEWRPDLLLKTLGKVDDLRPLFPKEYKFFSVHYSTFHMEAGTKFGIHLKETDLSQASENVVAFRHDFFESGVLIKLTESYVIIDN